MSEAKTISTGKTQLDRQREAFTIALAKRIHKHIKPHPDALDEDDVIVEREGWITEDELKAAAWIAMQECVDFDRWVGLPAECEREALKRNIL